jgi:hypothetical protein
MALPACSRQATSAPPAPIRTIQASGVDASLRGVSAVAAQVAWAVGRNGLIARFDLVQK